MTSIPGARDFRPFPAAEEDDWRAEEFLLAEAPATAQMGSWECDVARGAVFCSAEMKRLLRLGPDVWLRAYGAFLGQIHPFDRGALDAMIQNAVRTGRAFSLDHRLADNAGPTRWFSTRGRIAVAGEPRRRIVIATSQDITDRKKLEITRAHLSSIVDAVTEGVVGLDETGAILDANPAALQLFDRPAEDVVGVQLEPFMPEPARVEFRALLDEARRGRAPGPKHSQLSLPGDRVLDVQIQVVPLPDFRGHVEGIALLITPALAGGPTSGPHKAARSSRDRAGEGTKQLASQLTTLVEELRTCLTPVVMDFTVLEKRVLATTDADRDGYARMRRGLNRIGQAIDDLFLSARFAARAVQFTRRPARLSTMVTAALEACAARPTRQHPTVLTHVEGDPAVDADEDKMILALHRFFEASFVGFKGQRIQVRVLERAGRAFVHVDTPGPALTASQAALLMEPEGPAPDRAAPPRQASNLGMEVARRIILRHGGRFHLHDRGPASGTTVSVSLPLSAENRRTGTAA